MGGLFRAPKPTPAAAPAVEAAPVTISPAVPAAALPTAQEDAQLRLRHGIAGTVATSDRGVLAPLPSLSQGILVPARKTLLGE